MAKSFPSLYSSRLESAIFEDEFTFHYQPVISVLDNALPSLEALARWETPAGTFVSPSQFIPLLEDSGLMPRFTKYMILKLMGDILHGQSFIAGVKYSFNLSPLDLLSGSIAGFIVSALQDHGIDPSLLEVEITERVMIDPSARLMDQLNILSSNGIGIALDDFGAGYSSLSALAALPFTTVKIDQGLIRDGMSSRKTSNIIKSTISMARLSDITCVAEGVETEQVADFLICNGCTALQGYLFARPSPMPNCFLLPSNVRQLSEGVRPGLSLLATLAHLYWVSDVIRHILGHYSSTRGEVTASDELKLPELSPATCHLGRWIRSEIDHGRDDQEINPLAADHSKLHQIAEEVQLMVNSGKPFHEVEQALRQLLLTSNSVVRLASEIEFRARLEYRGLA